MASLFGTTDCRGLGRSDNTGIAHAACPHPRLVPVSLLEGKPAIHWLELLLARCYVQHTICAQASALQHSSRDCYQAPDLVFV